MNWTPGDTLRILLFACLFGMVMVAVLYLRQRKLSTLAYFMWGLLALMLPVDRANLSTSRRDFW